MAWMAMTCVISMQVNAFLHHSYLAQWTIIILAQWRDISSESVVSQCYNALTNYGFFYNYHDTWMTEMWKCGNKCFKHAHIQIGSSSDSWYQSPGPVTISRAPWDPVTLTYFFAENCMEMKEPGPPRWTPRYPIEPANAIHFQTSPCS